MGKTYSQPVYNFTKNNLTFLSFWVIFYQVRDTTTETKKMMNNKLNNWTSHSEQQRNLELPSKVQRLKRHNKILSVVIAAMVGVLIPLFFTAIVLACA